MAKQPALRVPRPVKLTEGERHRLARLESLAYYGHPVERPEPIGYVRWRRRRSA